MAPRKAAPGGKKTTMKGKAGGKPVSFKPGGLHESLGVPEGKPIPPAKMASALAGKEGPKAAAQARFAKNVLTGPKSSGSKPAASKPAAKRAPRKKG